MTEHDRLLRKKQDADELWQLLSSRLQRAQLAQARETRFEEQERIEGLLVDIRQRLQACESEQRAIEAQLAQLAGDEQRPVLTPGLRVSPSASPHLSRNELRRLLEALFVTDVELDAFCVDYFAEIYQRFTSGMERGQKHSLLLVHVPEAELAGRLWQHAPAAMSRLLPGDGGPPSGSDGRPPRS